MSAKIMSNLHGTLGDEFVHHPLCDADARTRLLAVRDHLSATAEGDWCVDVVRSGDGRRNCIFGHIFAMGRDDTEGNKWFDWFENVWGTTYCLYLVNDGTNPNYPQSTPKRRCLAFVDRLLSGEEDPTWVSMARQFAAEEARNGAE